MKRSNRHAAFLRKARQDYDALLASQGGKCAMCGRKPREGERFHIDHDHGKRKLTVRGVLCPWDNMHLRSWMKPDWLRLAALYLENGNRSEGQDDAGTSGTAQSPSRDHPRDPDELAERVD